MKLTELETDVLLKALELKRIKALEQRNEWRSVIHINSDSWTIKEKTAVQERVELLVFELNTLDRMIKSIKDGGGITCY